MALAPVVSDCQWDSEGGAVSIPGQWASDCTAQSSSGQERWYAVQTRSRHEKTVASLLQCYGVHTYLPLVSEVHNWSDRRKTVQVPLFSGYVFIRSIDSNEELSKVIRTEGVVSILGAGLRGTPVPNVEIESIRRLLAQKIPYQNHVFMDAGQRVRIRGGALDGVEGILLSQKSETSLVISVNMIQRSLAMRIDGYEVEAI
jgi:transcription antitermination factor NusG